MSAFERFATVTCPDCGHRQTEEMPTDACQFFYDCRGCGALLRPKPGDCCVFCAYGTVACPPIQAGDVAQTVQGARNPGYAFALTAAGLAVHARAGAMHHRRFRRRRCRRCSGRPRRAICSVL